ncbi:choline/ethanolamine kinase family protein [Sinomicrobium oceani]|uniref:choline/ethanolamine kinase family protein n=1 Tax=Sinomicrobium oceani TaxID=1150368 RepID=UPI00227ADB62|nr:choline/ethanolamine kinase family protein [Sinomicrobium oceani]
MKELVLDNVMINHESVLLRAQEFLQGEIIEVERNSLGMTNINYKCILDNGNKYMIRVPGLGSECLVNRDNENHVIKGIQSLGIDIKTVFFDVASGVKITEFVEDSNILKGNKIQMIDIGIEKLKDLHHSQAIFKNRFDFWNWIDNYLATCEKFGIRIKKSFFQMLNCLENFKVLPSLNPTSLLPCHNDPVPENFLVTKSGEVFLIDWEYGGMNDPVWDLAAFSLEIGLEKGEEERLLNLYYNHKYDKEIVSTKMLLNKVYQDLLWYLWSEIKIFFGQDISDYTNMRYLRGEENYNSLIKILD